MQKPPTVDVVVFFHNHEQFVEQALQSVFEQKVSFPVTVRIHDDASTDNTSEEIARLIKLSPFPTEVVRPETNRYQHGSRFKHAFLVDTTADFVAVLDGDDFWSSPEKLSKQVDRLQQDESIALCHHAYRVVRRGETAETVRFTGQNLVPGSLLASSNFIGTSSVVLRHSAIPPVMPDGFDKLRIDDWPIWALATQDNSIAYIDEVCSVYRLHESNYFANQDLEKKRYQSLMALVYITNSVRAEYQPLWLAALEEKVGKKTSIQGLLSQARRKLLG